MIKQVNKKAQNRKRHARLRVKLSGTTECPRLAVYRSTKHIYAQVIDDVKRVTLASASSNDKDLKEKLKNYGSDDYKVLSKTMKQTFVNIVNEHLFNCVLIRF